MEGTCESCSRPFIQELGQANRCTVCRALELSRKGGPLPLRKMHAPIPPPPLPSGRDSLTATIEAFLQAEAKRRQDRSSLRPTPGGTRGIEPSDTVAARSAASDAESEAPTGNYAAIPPPVNPLTPPVPRWRDSGVVPLPTLQARPSIYRSEEAARIELATALPSLPPIAVTVPPPAIAKRRRGLAASMLSMLVLSGAVGAAAFSAGRLTRSWQTLGFGAASAAEVAPRDEAITAANPEKSTQAPLALVTNATHGLAAPDPDESSGRLDVAWSRVAPPGAPADAVVSDGRAPTSPAARGTTERAAEPAPAADAVYAEVTGTASAPPQAANPAPAPGPSGSSGRPEASGGVSPTKGELKSAMADSIGVSSNAAPAPASGDARATSGEFNPAAAGAALERGSAAARQCGAGLEEPVQTRVAVTFSPSGRVTRAQLSSGPLLGTAAGGCVALAFRGVTVPPFQGEAVTVNKTVTISAQR